jgi:uncharacterized membrane protein
MEMPMNDFLQQVFALVCDQNPAHTWASGDGLLPLCQRCTGLYGGAALACLLMWRFRPIPNALYRWLHVVLLLLMTPFGFHLVSQDGLVRTMSGLWFGYGIVGILWLLPSARIAPPSRSGRRNGVLHLLLGLLSMIFLPLLAASGNVMVAIILSWLALVGLVALATLLGSNAFLLITGIAHRLLRPAGGVSYD